MSEAGGPPTAKPISLLLYEPHGIVADALAAVLESQGLEVVAVVDEADLAVEAALALAPGVGLVGVGFEPTVELLALTRLAQSCPAMPVVVLWYPKGATALLARVRKLAHGVVTASERLEAMTFALQLAAAGGTASRDKPSPARRPAIDSFSPAERRVVCELAGTPDTRARMARRLGVSTSTLDTQLASIKSKVSEELAQNGGLPADGFLSTEALIGWAIDHGFHYG